MAQSRISLTKFFLDRLRSYRWQVILMLSLGVVWALISTFSPYVLKLIIDQAMACSAHKLAAWSAVGRFAILYVFLDVLQSINYRLLSWNKLRLLPQIRYDIVQSMFDYLLGQTSQYFKNNFAGSLANKIADMQSGVINIYIIFDATFAQIVSLIIAIIMMWTVASVFVIIFLIWGLVFALITRYCLPSITQLAHVFATSKSTLMGKMVDSISNITNIRLFARHQFELNLVEQATMETITNDRAMQWALLKMNILWDISMIAVLGIELYTLVTLYSQNLVSVGDFAFIIGLSAAIFQNLWWIVSQFVQLAEELGKCSQALSILTEPHGIIDQPHAVPLVVSHGELIFKDVTFGYETSHPLFEHFNLTIPAGQKVGLVGFSGSGKTSFVQLVLRLADIQAGSITIDQQNIAEVTQDSLHQQMIMIPQDISLFHRSLLDNIRYGQLDASDEAVIEASKKAHCHEFIEKLPEGYQSLVGERGIKLSGGQRQRIAIARAMLKNAPILMLDEATSALDSVTEGYIQHSLQQLMVNKTTIIIAHRLSTLAQVDRIVVFDHGQIVEDGTHDELLAQQGHYARMWHLQAGGFLPEQE